MVPKILFLKQTASIRHWFVELGIDLSKMVGETEMYTGVAADEKFDDLTIWAAPPYRKDSDVIRLWSWFKYFLGAARHVLRSSPKTLLFIVAQPPYLPLLGYIRNKLYGQKYVVWIDDVLPDLLIRHKRLSAQSLISRFWKLLNIIMYSRAERVITLGPCMAEVLRKYIRKSDGNRERVITIVPTWVDSEFIKPIPKDENHFAKKYGQIGKLTILYSGNFGLSHDFDTIVDAARKLKDRTDIHFVIIGEGPQRAMLEKAEKDLNNLTLLPFQPEDIVPYSLTMGEIAVVSLGKNFEGISMPSKAYYMMSAGAALIGLSKRPSDLQMVIEKNQCGVNIEPGDVGGFIEAVFRFADDRSYLEQCRQNARQAAVDDYSRHVNVHRVFKIIRSVRGMGEKWGCKGHG